MEIVQNARQKLADLQKEVDISGISLRSHDVRPGDLFAALPGLHVHGATFASDAAADGAVAILTDHEGSQILDDSTDEAVCALPRMILSDIRQDLGEISAIIYGNPSQAMSVVGITGTSGKTTTAYMVESIFRTAGHSAGMIGTTGTRLNGQPLPSSLTTPEAPDLQRLFAHMVEEGADRVVMEVSSHSIALKRVNGTHFRIGAFLNLSQDHLDFHPTMDDYFATKSQLFTPDSGICCDHAVICLDDEWGQRLYQHATEHNIPVTTVSLQSPADYTAGPSTTHAAGEQTCSITTPQGTYELTLPMPGRYNVANALVALAIAELCGVQAQTAVDGIARVVVPGRVQRIDGGQDFLAVVDYAHKPAAVAAVIHSLRSEVTGRLAVVLGAGGDRDSSKRTLMGAEAARGADLVIITDDNPRSEDPALIREAVEKGARDVPQEERGEVRVIGDRHQAIIAAIDWAEPGDAVIVAGKGHETGQLIKGVMHPFDDRQVVEEALRARMTRERRAEQA